MRETEAAQHPPNSPAVDGDVMRLGQFRHQLVKRNLTLFSDTALDPAGHARQFAVPAAIALATRCQRPRFAAQLDQIVHKSRRNPEMPRRLTVTVPLIDERDNALS